jgi:hypothetical protein
VIPTQEMVHARRTLLSRQVRALEGERERQIVRAAPRLTGLADVTTCCFDPLLLAEVARTGRRP